ncbi:uncharacterized protein BJ171DRAFT_157461 [Polychytrium aggregatum]|uniref:uncharacterized protein n=1 Tax=Polychytrium aggregatum TaxID=110093 RepID=UPI0022FDB72A|nr:uncharacterized protein BJ171DRAFT_157461 [Polychytrium aggregatum]KAI9202973.1 hypothetical protein BJ171DRAFT_157461 [Polychytrium aggregatum]
MSDQQPPARPTADQSLLGIREKPPASLLLNEPPQEPPKTFRSTGPSDLLSRVGQFLPQIQAANVELSARIQQGESVDIEQIAAKGARYIQMDLGLGVFDVEPKARERTGDEITLNPNEAAERGTARKRPKIQVLGSEPSEAPESLQKRQKVPQEGDLDRNQSCNETALDGTGMVQSDDEAEDDVENNAEYDSEEDSDGGESSPDEDEDEDEGEDEDDSGTDDSDEEGSTDTAGGQHSRTEELGNR